MSCTDEEFFRVTSTKPGEHMDVERYTHTEKSSCPFAAAMFSNGKVPTKWHGVRTRSDEACSYRCNGRAFPVDYIPPKPRRHAHDLKPKRPAPLNRASYPSASIPDANCDPKQYGALRLANSPTASSIRAVRNRYEDELHKHKRSRANLGRLMFADMNQALVYDME